MEIHDNYLGLLNTLIYDKRSKTCGMLSDIRLMKGPDGIVIHYSAYMNSLCPNQPVFIENFEKCSEYEVKQQ